MNLEKTNRIFDLALIEYENCFNHHHEQTKTRQAHFNFLLISLLGILAFLKFKAQPKQSELLLFSNERLNSGPVNENPYIHRNA